MVIITTNLNFTDFTLQQTHYKYMLLITSRLFWGLDNNLSKYLAQKMDVANIVQMKSAIGRMMLLIIALLVFRININVETEQLIPILVLGSIGFATSLFFFLQGLKKIGTEQLQYFQRHQWLV